MPHVRDADGNVVADNLTPAEIDRLQSEGVPVHDDADDADGDPGEAGGASDGDADDPADDAPDADPDDTGGSGGSSDPADDDPEADPDTDGGGGSGDAPDDAPEPDDDDADPGEPGGSGGGSDDAPDDTDPVDDPTSAGSDGSAADDDGAPDTDGEPDDSRADDDPTDAADDQTHGPDTGPDLDLDDLDDPDEWDDWDDEGSGDGPPVDDDTTADDDADDDAGNADRTGNRGDKDDVGTPELGDDSTPDDLDDAVDDMVDRSDDRDALGDKDIDTSKIDDDMWRDRVDRASRERFEERQKRDEADQYADWVDPNMTSREIDDWTQRTGIRRDIREKFEAIKTGEKPRNARSGSRVDRRRAKRFKRGDTTADDFYLRGGGMAERDSRAVGVALDASGSMCPLYPDDRERIDQAKVAVAGLADACEAIGDDFTALSFAGHASTPDNGLGDTKERTTLITGPNERFDMQQLDAIQSGGGTPMGKGVLDTALALKESPREDKTIFVVCDGEADVPGVLDDPTVEDRREDKRWDDGTDHAHRIIEEVRADGIGVVGVGIGDDVSEASMYRTFREDGKPNQTQEEAPYVMCPNPEDLADGLVNAYEGQLDSV